MSASGATQEAARIHRRVRRQHQSEIAQDYLEAVYRMTLKGQTTRVTDIQDVFGVSHVTVIRTLARLERDHLLVKASSGVALTEAGEQIAVKSYRRHNLVKRFLLQLGVSETTAAADTEGIEHHLSEETLQAMQDFLEDQEKG